jgi:8-amino-7-oxononanoate synthase
MESSFDSLIEGALGDLEARHLMRRRRSLEIIDATHVEFEGRRYVNFASNNYLGLTHHPALIEAARRASARHGVGSGAAPLVTGHSRLHAEAEAALANWKGTEDALLLPSGYQANHAAVGAVAALAGARGERVRFLFDKLVHASLIDAIRATGAEYRIFPHNGTAKLERLLAEAEPGERQVVVTESVFSMDGDLADLAALAELRTQYGFLLIVDEAHASGVYGPAGAGLAAELGLRDAVDLSMATLSKALGGIGGVICASRNWCDVVVNFARAYLFSTALPPAVAAVAKAAVDVMQQEPQRQARVRNLARQIRAGLGMEGDSPIVPVIIGDEKAAVEASETLKNMGFWVPAIRPPTVAAGTSRLRVTLSAAHTDGEVQSLVDAIQSIRRV